MEHLFIRALNVSITASFLVLAVIIYRIFAKSAPRWVSVLLWGLVGVRLLLPFSIESEVSLIPSESTVPETITHDRYPTLDTGFGGVDEIVNPLLSGTFEAHPEYSANPMQIVITVAGWVWLAVSACMLIFTVGSFIYLRAKTRINVRVEENIFICDSVKSPFILGIFKPRIYLPSDISERNYGLVVAHECAHIARLDHIWKPLGFLLLSLYWFNPLLWISYALFCRDIEGACDERVIEKLDGNEKADYAEALLSLGAKNRFISACPLTFGEVSVKSRIVSVSRYKKPAAAVVAICVTVCAIFAACFLTYKKSNTVEIGTGIWYPAKIVCTANGEAVCDDAPRIVFAEGSDVLVESSDNSGLSYVRLGKMNRAYVSQKEYASLFEGVSFRESYSADMLFAEVESVIRITPSMSSGIECDEVYLLRSENALYMGYRYGERIPLLYEMKLGETLPTYLYNAHYLSEDVEGAEIVLDTEARVGRVTFGGAYTSYEARGSYVYNNSKIILTTDDDFALRLVFIDTGDALVFSQAQSELRGLSGFFPDGTTLFGYYRFVRRSSDTRAFDIDGDGSAEVIFAFVGADGSLYSIIHRYKTIAENTVPFPAYDLISFEEAEGELYLVCEYSDTDLRLHRYRVTFDGENLVFTEVEI